jgi:metallophosphoesterase (TIGR00282 family)
MPSDMKILIFGDIFGRMGRELTARHLPALKEAYAPDFIVGNSENLTSGKGPVPEHVTEFAALGFDCLTGGNHVFSHLKELAGELQKPDTIQIRPANYYDVPGYQIPGKGWRVCEKAGKRLLVVNLLSGVFLKDQVYNPFLKIDEILVSLQGERFDGIIVDFHRETTAESYCMAEHLSGRASFVYGTHTHVQTNDEHILESGTGMITDVGMTGPLHSAIGQAFEGRLPTFITGVGLFSKKPEPLTEGPGVVNAVFVEIEDGKCRKVEKIRIRE